MNDTPIDFNTVKSKIEESGLAVVGNASIRELVHLVNRIEQATGTKYVRMEMGVPGLMPPEIGTNAEIDALKRGVAAKYPMIEGVTELKNELSRFVKLFLNLNVSPENCIPTVGSMQGAFAAFMVGNRTDTSRMGTLFLDPGFPVQKQQIRVLGQTYKNFDVYNYRGDKLRDKLEEICSENRFCTMIYSNPNNPSWICFTDKELRIIADIANKYDIIVIEDLAYFAMDFRKDYSKPGLPPYQPSVGQYTDNYLLLISGSKAFSYAGQRIAGMIISDALFCRKYQQLLTYYTSDSFGYAMIYNALYSLSSGVTHSAQFGLAAMLKAANDGDFNFVNYIKEYGKRANLMKTLFIENGFKIVYDKDEDEPIADGFYFTFSYQGMTGTELLEKLLYYGISAISLNITGSERHEGLRACVSQISLTQLPDLEYRLKTFNQHHSK